MSSAPKETTYCLEDDKVGQEAPVARVDVLPALLPFESVVEDLAVELRAAHQDGRDVLVAAARVHPPRKEDAAGPRHNGREAGHERQGLVAVDVPTRVGVEASTIK